MKISEEHYTLTGKSLLFIEEHLGEELSLAGIAENLNCSLFHFSRVFNRVTHHTPYDYIMRRRLSEAAGMLRNSRRGIIHIAMDVGFNNPETFSRAFKKLFSLSPKEFRKQNHPSSEALMPCLTEDHLLFRNEKIIKKKDILEKLQLDLRGVMTLGKNYSSLPPLEKLMKYPEKPWHLFFPLEDSFFYFLSVEEEREEPAYYVHKRIGPVDFIRFFYKGAIEEAKYMKSYIFQTWQKPGEKKVSDRMHMIRRGTSPEEWELYLPR